MGSLVLLKAVLSVHDEEGPVSAGFSADWVSDAKPRTNCAVVWLITEPIPPGAKGVAILQPMDSEFWETVVRGTELRAMVGPKHVATAKVLSVYRTR